MGNISRLSLHPATRLSLALPASSTSSIVSKMMRLSRQLNVARTSARLMSTHVQPSLTQFETSLTENARQLLGNDSPTTVLPLVREARCHALDPRRPPAVTPYLIRATHSTSSCRASQALEKKRELYGHIHPSTIASMHSLAGMLIVDGRMEEASPLIREATVAAQVLATGR